MNLRHYNLEATKDFLEYNFYSQGPKGSIKKIVRFTKVTASGFTYYNLGFGDWDEKNDAIDDFVISNNQDADRVLATVAASVIDFSDHYPEVFIYAEGSTISRTRRYQMGINKFRNEIESFFEIFGLVENEGFVPFEPGKNFKAFVVKRKPSIFMWKKKEVYYGFR
jgi:hypothetical protein